MAGGKLLVLDPANHRILVWNDIPTSNMEPADVVIGQPNFIENTLGTSATKFWEPMAMTVAEGKLFVADSCNSRILIWNEIPTASGQAADVVVGHDDFTSGDCCEGTSAYELCRPMGIDVKEGKMFVADTNNHRVLIWNNVPTTNAPADLVLGQPDMLTNANGRTQGQFESPERILASGSRIYVADSTNSRVLVWNQIPSKSSVLPDLVLGVPDFVTAGNGSPTATSMGNPVGLAVLGSQLFVADQAFDRVLVFDETPPTPTPTLTELQCRRRPLVLTWTGIRRATRTILTMTTTAALMSASWLRARARRLRWQSRSLQSERLLQPDPRRSQPLRRHPGGNRSVLHR